MTRATAIWNQESIVELLTRELARTAREGGDLAVMLAGIDSAKSGNRDSTQNDTALSEIAKRFSALLRTYDHVGRYGSEQLLVVIPGCDLNEVLPVAEKLRQSIAEVPIPASGNGIPVTVSIALVNGNARDEQDLLREASGLLHRAQVQGGNRVELVKKLPGAVQRIAPKRKLRLSLLIAGVALAAVAVLWFVAPSSFCTPFLLHDALSSSELPPPLPADCAPTSERPSDATIQGLETQRQARGLVLEGTVTCKISSSGPKDHSAQIDQQWLDTIYVNGTMQYKRHVLLAAHENVKGGTLFTVEQCVMPLWTYVSQPQDRCWEAAEFWR
ncbi:MAG TPA: GGDEF domain-containing protein [Terriglobales bacterium]|nr:GGDEF domain-containing protein [Terriglobales bacterium]